MFDAIKRWVNPKSMLPEQWQHARCLDIPLLAIDLELTSLDVKESNILSIGWVAGLNNQIALSSCFYQVITTRASLNQSPVIHGLTDEHIVQGAPIRPALETLQSFARSHVWLFHNTELDMPILRKVFNKLQLPLPRIVTLDTLRLALYQLQRKQQVAAPNAATLTFCRQRHDLPQAPIHNALDDALATLELFYAQWSEFDPSGEEKLAALMGSGCVKVYPPLDVN